MYSEEMNIFNELTEAKRVQHSNTMLILYDT